MATTPHNQPDSADDPKTSTYWNKGKVPHGEPHNINLLVRDIDDECTGFGKHNRLVVFGSTDGTYVHIREDIIPGRNLKTATPAQRLKVANGGRRIHPRGARLKYVSSTPPYQSSNGSWWSIDHMYDVIPIPRKGA